MIPRLLALALLTASPVAHADFWVTVGGGQVTPEFDDVSNSTALSLSGGYQFKDSPLFFDLALVDLGSADVDNTTVSVDITGAALTAGYSSNRYRLAPLTAYAKAGVASLSTDVVGTYRDGSQIDSSASSTGALLTGGIEVNPGKRVSLFAEASQYFTASYVAKDGSLMTALLGLKVWF